MTRILNLSENKRGRDFVVGDIHGAFELLTKALKQAEFDPTKDRLISVGDLVDRGPDSAASLKFLQHPWFYAVRGNHEDMFLAIVREDGTFDPRQAKDATNIQNGLGWIFKQSQETLKAIHEKFAALPLAIKLETPRGSVGCVHAQVPTGMHWQEFIQALEAGDNDVIQCAMWGRSRIKHNDDSGTEGIDRVFHGHTPQEGGARRLGNCYFIDTGAVFRMTKGYPQCGLTVSNVLSMTVCFDRSAQRDVDEARVIDKAPTDNKPFGMYTKPPKDDPRFGPELQAKLRRKGDM